MTCRLSLQQVEGAFLQLQGQEQTAGFGTHHVTAGPHLLLSQASASQSGWAAQPIPSKLEKFSSSRQPNAGVTDTPPSLAARGL